MKILKKVPHHYRTYDTIDLKFKSAKELMSILADAIEKYGAEQVLFDVSTRYEYGEETPMASLFCWREMTAEEKQKYEESRINQSLAIENSERAMYLRLKEKYENR